MDFQWDRHKDAQNARKHGVGFAKAAEAFLDERRVVLFDRAHSGREQRYFLLGMVDRKILTVRSTVRGSVIRIFGAGFWRKGKELYEQAHAGR